MFFLYSCQLLMLLTVTIGFLLVIWSGSAAALRPFIFFLAKIAFLKVFYDIISPTFFWCMQQRVDKPYWCGPSKVWVEKNADSCVHTSIPRPTSLQMQCKFWTAWRCHLTAHGAHILVSWVEVIVRLHSATLQTRTFPALQWVTFVYSNLRSMGTLSSCYRRDV